MDRTADTRASSLPRSASWPCGSALQHKSAQSVKAQDVFTGTRILHGQSRMHEVGNVRSSIINIRNQQNRPSSKTASGALLLNVLNRCSIAFNVLHEGWFVSAANRVSPAASDDLNMIESSVSLEKGGTKSKLGRDAALIKAGCPLVPIYIFVEKERHRDSKNIPEMQIVDILQEEERLFRLLCHMVQCGRQHLSKAQWECGHSVWGQVSGGRRNRDPVFLIRQLPGGAAHERTEPQDKDAGHLKGMGARFEQKARWVGKLG
jgi:hypothetical protein